MFPGLAEVINDVESRPQVVLAWRHIEALLAHAQFSTAGEIVDEFSEKRHYSLNLSSLTYFTKPLSRCALVTLRQAAITFQCTFA